MSNQDDTSNLENLNVKQIDELSFQIGESLRKIIDQACKEANEICNKYGLEAKMQFVLEKKENKGS